MFVKNNYNSFLFKTLGSLKFLSFLKIANVIIGNSSSGILEMPTFNKPTINIGNRQEGRVKANTIINVHSKKNLIKKAINFVFSKNNNKKNIIYNYKKNHTSAKICLILKNIRLKNYQCKKFYDI